jgi:hypothetical protein
MRFSGTSTRKQWRSSPRKKRISVKISKFWSCLNTIGTPSENPPAFGLSPHLITAPNPAVHRPVRAQRGPARGDSLAGCADGAKRAQGGSAPTAALGTHGFDYSRGQGQLFWLPCRRSRAWAPYMSSRFFFADRYVETGAPYTVVRRAHRIAG